MNDGWQDRSLGFESGGAEYLRRLKQDLEKKPSTPTPVPAAAQTESSPSERRTSPRYKCEGSAEFRAPGSDVRTWGTFTDLSVNGCYIEMTATFPVGSTVDLILNLSGVRAEVTGEVRVSYPFLGIGVAFREVTAANQIQLEKMIRALCPATPVVTESPSSDHVNDSLVLPANINAMAALRLLADFFESHPLLTKEEFARIMGGGTGSAL